VSPPVESSIRFEDKASEMGCREFSGGTVIFPDAAAAQACKAAERQCNGALKESRRNSECLLNSCVFLPVSKLINGSIQSLRSFAVGFQSDTWTDVAPDELVQYVSEEQNPENAKSVAGVEVFLPSPLLADGMCFVDTPGLGSIFAGNTAATQAFVPQIDAAIIVVGADPPIAGEEMALVEEVSRHVRHLVVVLNKADRATEAERQIAVPFTRKVLEKRLQRPVDFIYEISAVERLQQNKAGWDWNLLVASLEKLVDESGRTLVRPAGERGAGV
jgi:Dynamin family